MAYHSRIYKAVYQINEMLIKNKQPYFLHVSECGGFGYGEYHNSVNVFSSDAKLMLLSFDFKYVDKDDSLTIVGDDDFECKLGENDYDDFYSLMMVHINNVKNGYDILSDVFNVELWYGFSVRTPRYEKYKQKYVIKYNMLNATFVIKKYNSDDDNSKHYYALVGEPHGYKNIDDVCKIILNETPELRVKSLCERFLSMFQKN